MQKRFLPLPPSLSSVPLPSSLHNTDLENGHTGIFPRIEILWLTAFSGFSNTCTSVLLHMHIVEYIPIPLWNAFAQYPRQMAVIKHYSDATCSLSLHSCKVATDSFVPMSSNC